jgi:hypothetical protein
MEMTRQEELERAKQHLAHWGAKCKELHQMIADKWEDQPLAMVLRIDLRYYEGMCQAAQAAVDILERHLKGPVYEVKPSDISNSLINRLNDARVKGGLHV